MTDIKVIFSKLASRPEFSVLPEQALQVFSIYLKEFVTVTHLEQFLKEKTTVTTLYQLKAAALKYALEHDVVRSCIVQMNPSISDRELFGLISKMQDVHTTYAYIAQDSIAALRSNRLNNVSAFQRTRMSDEMLFKVLYSEVSLAQLMHDEPHVIFVFI